MSSPLPALASGFLPTTDEVVTSMDPRLQRLLLQLRQGSRLPASASTSADEIAVLARVSDLPAWNERIEVRPGVAIAGSDSGDWIVTARIPLSRVEQVRTLSFVQSLKAPRRIHPALAQTVENVVAAPEALPAGNAADGGRGVVIGIIDFGCDFAHQNFRNDDGTTRILSIWDQRPVSFAGGEVGYGKVYDRDRINEALTAADPYQALGYGPEEDNAFEIGSHGTHVMDIAAGNGRGSGVPGVAPEADIIFVELGASDVAWTGPGVVGNNFGDSVQLLEAVEYIFRKAGDRPCIVNLSLGTNGGPHDGTTLVEEGIDRLIGAAPNRTVVIAASNSWDDGIHASGSVGTEPGSSADLSWEIPVSDTTPCELEIWYGKQDRFSVELIAPNGISLITVGPGSTRTLSLGSRVVATIANRLSEPNNEDNLIDIYFEADMPKGKWTIRLHGQSVTGGLFHAWIERDDNGQSKFSLPRDNSHTLGSISCGKETIVVGSFDGHKSTMPLSWFSSEGPTRDGREKPEISAPGHNVVAAHSRAGDGVTRKSGTSMAAPAVSGCIALMLAQARTRNLVLTAREIREMVIASANKDVNAGKQWDSRYGFGRVSAEAMVRAAIERPVTVDLTVTLPSGQVLPQPVDPSIAEAESQS